MLISYIKLEKTVYISLVPAAGDPKGQSASCAIEYCDDDEPKKEKEDSFDEVYKPQELTDFDSLFNRNITRSTTE